MTHTNRSWDSYMGNIYTLTPMLIVDNYVTLIPSTCSSWPRSPGCRLSFTSIIRLCCCSNYMGMRLTNQQFSQNESVFFTLVFLCLTFPNALETIWDTISMTLSMYSYYAFVLNRCILFRNAIINALIFVRIE